jgi:predicted amidohydrolase YtcJ
MRTLFRAGAVYGTDHPAATALIVEDGLVAWAGPAPDAATAGPVDRDVDLGAALITPAFVDAHVHVTDTGLAIHGLDLTAARSVPQVLDLVAAAADRGDQVVLGHGWDERLLAEGRPPTAAELDRAGRGRPVYLSRVDVHSAVVSTRLAEDAGAARLDGWDPCGRVERDAHHAARSATRDRLPAAARRQAQLAALRAAAAAGIAAVHEMSAPHVAPEEDLRALMALTGDQPAGDEPALPAVIAYRGHLVGDDAEAKAVLERLAVPVAGLAGDLCVDGSIGSRTAAYLDDYCDAPGRGHLYLTVEQVRDHVAACTRAGVQAGFHVIGDAAVEVARRGIRRAAEQVGIAAVRAARHRLEHVESIDAEGGADLADLRVTASVQPAFDALWGGPDGMYAARLGTERAGRMNPFGALASAGVALACGSDSPVTRFDPWGAVASCVGHHEAAQRLGVATAFAAHTVGGWWAGGVDGAGRLPVGAPATFAAWQLDAAPDGTGLPRLDGLDGGARPRCLLTVRSGRVLHDAR